MYYVVSIVSGDNYGKVISAHHDHLSAIKKLDDNTLIITTDDRLKKGEVYAELTATKHAEKIADDRGLPAWESCDLSPLAKLASINPDKAALCWKFRAVTINGTMNKTAFGVIATASVLRGAMEITLSPDMVKADALVNASFSAQASA